MVMALRQSSFMRITVRYDQRFFKDVSTRPSHIAHGNGLYAYGDFSIFLGHDASKCCCCAGLDPKIVQANPPDLLYIVRWKGFLIHHEPFLDDRDAIQFIKDFEATLP